MASIWVVEKGSYSDYRVVGVCTSQANAQILADKCNATKASYQDSATVAEWPLDPGVEQINQGMNIWFVRMARDGTVESHGDGSYDIEERFDVNQFGTFVIAYVWASDANHAIKIVNEKRIQALALGTWKMPKLRDNPRLPTEAQLAGTGFIPSDYEK